ncbi:large conductance mechanosensitive channel protein MscL [Winogradskyella undariae]|uniref:large conductance mechanosensitive channel protein MscL n=1 Tax=Winogradskyella TaxID=286104 RepID=UPI00156A9B39|nr:MULTISPECIES: large conductance mechanosensitive channel protein MscL [Winogradskyella]NRR91319.1 large conductance mechanosensitive channel protein MscL [Winogradskyella undariae]QNK76926.1 large conductance mechanosensitive channel protein MscL [Winogradskyella sp. PAMC22761]QXP80501.1 large conductance mechanosensitive channel protein MscL [Winogradskyella sp. HaHa_3_26]
MLKEFKEFAMKGNLIDIAVGFVMGAAFKEVVTAFTGGIVSPLIGMIFDSDFKALRYQLKEGTLNDAGEMVGDVFLEYGTFLTNVIDFIIVAFVMFLVVKGVNNMKKKEEPAPAAPAGPTELDLLKEIRDSLKK